MKNKYLYWGIPLIGVIFCLWYVKQATNDVVYSDYIRLVNSYLPDVWNPDKLLVPDILTRIPINYLGRIINISFFGFSITFDRVAGIIGLGMAAIVLSGYCLRKSIGFLWFLLSMVIMFSLNKWEMLTNGSGWSHFLAFAGFYYHYEVLDRVWSGEEKPYDRMKLIVLPFVITLFLAGPYCAIYSVTVILAYLFCIVIEFKKTHELDRRYLIYMIATGVPLLLYMWSNSYAVEDHAGAVSEPLLTALMEKTVFFGRFFLKSFSSMIMGDEVMFKIIPSDQAMLLLGMLVIGAYLLALWLNIKYHLYEKTIFPLLLIVAGGLNHVLILVSRWIFIDENYGMSSRYALQFQIGILGIVFTFALLWKQMADGKKNIMCGVAAMFCGIFLIGNCVTSYEEIKKAPYREERFDTIAAAAISFENKTDEELQAVFEYRPREAGSGAKIRSALEILKQNNWNIFNNRH